MIPHFPEFKPIELSDKEDVEKFTNLFPPYSDFNFVSMYSWDVKGEMAISELNNNLVVKFNDYLTGEPFYSFIGAEKIDQTVNDLLEFTIEKGFKPRLYLIPEVVAQDLDLFLFKIEEDRDNFDYIYDLTAVSELKGGQFMSQRNKINSFKRKYPGITVQVIDVHSEEIKKQITELEEDWLLHKAKKDINFKFQNELLATTRFIDSKVNETITVGIYDGDKLIGYTVTGLLSNDYAISHFTKADIDYVGVYEYLLCQSAKILAKERKYLNFEQDLGLPGLRGNKKAFMSKFLKKYTVTFPD